MTEAWLKGRRGQALAAGIALLILALCWYTTVAPVWSWFDDRGILLIQHQALLQRMQDVAATLPRLREVSAKSQDRRDSGTAVMLPGSTDALAAAGLQERVQRMATTVGASLATVETMPAATVGDWHKVSLRISLNAPWPVLIDLLRSIENSLIQVDDIHFHSAVLITRSTVLPIQASMVLYGFRAARAEAGT
jgi:general secretion pathway protein M